MYLLEERVRHEDDTWDGRSGRYSTTADRLRQMADAAGWEAMAMTGWSGADAVTGANPDNPNASLVYEVQVVEEVPTR